MKELSHCIISLLADNDCVILPGIGGFITHYESAKYNSDEECFISPKRIVGFNNAITLNDGLLVQAYMQIHDLNYPDASRLLNKDLQKVQKDLEEKGSFHIEGFGVLSRQNKGTYQFTASSIDILTPGLYALSDIYVKSFAFAPKEETIKTIKLETSKIEEAIIPQQKILGRVIEQETENLEESEEKPSNVYTLSMRRSFVHGLFAAAAAIIIFALISFPLDNSLNKKSRAAILYDVLDDAPQAITSISQKVTPQNVTNVENNIVESINTRSTKSIKVEKTINKETLTTVKPYTIVLASSVAIDNAKVFISNLEKKGYNLAEIQESKNMRRIIYSHFSTESEAYNALQNLRKQDFASEAWVMKIEK